MKTVLIGWELGAGRGHVEQLVPIVRAYLGIGWRVITAMRDVPLAHQAYAFATANPKLLILQAPRFFEPPPKYWPPHSLPEIFCNIGFDEPELVGTLITRWERLLHAHKPDLIISDFAPNLNMAARQRIPIIAIGNGWTMPPDTSRLPAFGSPAGESADRDPYSDQIISCARRVMGAERSIERFCDMLRGDINVVCTVPELDPCYKHRNEKLYWPLAISAASTQQCQSRHEAGLIYLPVNHPAIATVEAGVAAANLQFTAYFGGQQLGETQNLSISAHPINFADELPHKRLVIHHGGLGTAIWCMVNRVPQLICPQDIEKQLIAEALVKGRSGGMFRPEIAPIQFADLISRALRLDVPEVDFSAMATQSPAETLKVIMESVST